VTEPKLEYFISQRGEFLVASLIGVITKSTSDVLLSCARQIAEAGKRCVVIVFHDVRQIEVGGIPVMVKLQMAARDGDRELRVCFIRPDLQRQLIDAGAIRQNEITESLVEALQSFGQSPDGPSFQPHDPREE
jgi:anti-anti-sigma regulatory factor